MKIWMKHNLLVFSTSKPRQCIAYCYSNPNISPYRFFNKDLTLYWYDIQEKDLI